MRALVFSFLLRGFRKQSAKLLRHFRSPTCSPCTVSDERGGQVAGEAAGGKLSGNILLNGDTVPTDIMRKLRAFVFQVGKASRVRVRCPGLKSGLSALFFLAGTG